MTPRPRNARTDALGRTSRERVLASAEQLFALKGFAGTSMSDIAKGAEAGKGSIYWHFESKDDILLALLEQRAEAWIAESVEAARSAEGLVAKVDAALAMAERRMRRDKDALRLLLLTLLERSAVDARVRKRVREVYRRYRAETERELAAMMPMVPPAQRRAIGVLVLGAFDGLFLQWQLDPQEVDTEQLIGDLRDGVRMIAALFGRG
ncbi:MAG: TetR/AcrR family transcriptional regulator [Deltaproteobacteria bacterium]|nr:TetR/AcrR family transcriptional regulator [Deltaproteobacteria bacterium]